MKNRLIVIFVLAGFNLSAQTSFRTQFATAANGPFSVAGNRPFNAKEWKYDSLNFVWRPFRSYAEATAWLPVNQRFVGIHAYIDSTGTVATGANAGKIIGGLPLPADFVYNSSLVLIPMPTGGGSYPIDTANKWINTIQKNTNGDSLVFYKGGGRTAIKLPGVDSVLQSGTGAASRTISSKINEVFSVKDFSSTGNGTTDDKAAIQSAVTATGTGTLVFPKGDYLIGGANNILSDGVNITQSNISVSGTAGSVLMQKNNSYYTMSINAGSGGSPDINNNVKNIVIENMVFKGTVTTDGFSEFRHLLNINAATNVTVRNCQFYNWRGDAILIGSSNVGGVERHNKNITIENCYFNGGNKDNRNAISVIDVDGLIIRNCRFENCSRFNMPGAIDIEPDALSFHIVKNIVIDNNTFTNIGGTNGVIGLFSNNTVDSIVQNITIENNTIEKSTNTGAGISLITGRNATDSSRPNGFRILNNTILNTAKPILCFGVKGATIEGNNCEFSTLPVLIGYVDSILANTRSSDITIANNTFQEIGSSFLTGLTIHNVKNLTIDNNRFIDCYGYAIQFDNGISSAVNITNNTFRAPKGKTNLAIVKEVAHTFTPATNYYFNNKLNGLPSAFVSFRTDDDQILNTFSTATLPYAFPLGESSTIVNTGTLPEGVIGRLMTRKMSTNAGVSDFIIQTFQPNTTNESYTRHATDDGTNWSNWDKVSGLDGIRGAPTNGYGTYSNSPGTIAATDMIYNQAAGTYGFGGPTETATKAFFNGKVKAPNLRITDGALPRYILGALDSAGNTAYFNPATLFNVKSTGGVKATPVGDSIQLDVNWNGKIAGDSLLDYTDSTTIVTNRQLNRVAKNTGTSFFTGSGTNISSNNSGNVGIGISTPITKLHIRGNETTPTTNDVSSTLLVTTTATAAAEIGPSLRFSGESGNGVTPYAFAVIQGSKETGAANNYSGALRIYTTTSDGGVTEKMRITSGGSVGVGTTDPQAKLHVNGNLKIVVAEYADNAAAVTAGLTVGTIYRTADILKIVH